MANSVGKLMISTAVETPTQPGTEGHFAEMAYYSYKLGNPNAKPLEDLSEDERQGFIACAKGLTFLGAMTGLGL